MISGTGTGKGMGTGKTSRTYSRTPLALALTRTGPAQYPGTRKPFRLSGQIREAALGGLDTRRCLVWQCAACRRLMRSSGMHRLLRVKNSAFYRCAGLCPMCAEIHDRREGSMVLWKTSLGFGAVALFCGLASYVLLSLQ